MRWNRSTLAMISLTGCLALGGIVGHAGPTPARAPRPVAPEDIPRLMRELDSSRFQTRQQATRRLVEARAIALPALKTAALGNVAEVAMRAVEILGEIQRCQHAATVDLAELTLYEIRKEASPTIAQLCERILEMNYPIVQNRAVANIESLGGVVTYYSREDIQVFNPAMPPDPLAPHEQVESVILSDDWKGGDDGLKYVRRMKKLPVIFIVSGSKVTEEAREKLQADMPKLRVQSRGRAFLGVTMHPDPLGRGCQIIKVREGSAAEKAELKSGDIIATFDGNPTPDPDTLINLIGNYQPGNRIPVERIRLGRKETITVVLGVWK